MGVCPFLGGGISQGSVSVLCDLRNSRMPQAEINLPGWRWARIKQLALVGSSSSWHSEACKALGGSSGAVHSKISDCGSLRTRGCLGAADKGSALLVRVCSLLLVAVVPSSTVLEQDHF